MARSPRPRRAPPRPSSRRALRVAIPAAILLAALALVLTRRPAPPEPEPDPTAAAPPSGAARAPSPPPRAARPPIAPSLAPDRGAPGDPADPSAADPAAGDERTLWQKRLARAQHTLDSYLESTRYPPESRPITETPDLVRPHHVDPVTLPLARDDGKLTDARVRLHQDRFFLVGDERAALTVTCETSEGPARCELVSSTAAVPPSAPGAGARPAAPVPFEPGPDGALLASFQPASQGFAGYHGTIRVSVTLHVDGETGAASFDVQYTPSAPAVFTGKVREVVAEGSLDLHPELEVERPGRYVISARVDDADGKSFAYLNFNEELPAGRQEPRLRVFGKLIRDLGARSPFRLRDVEGFLLKENVSPDRETIPALDGTVHTTRRYEASDFSEAEWQSEERDRYIKELTKDVDEATDKAR